MILLISLLLAGFFCGCMQLDIRCGIDEQYNAYLRLDTQTDLSELEFGDQTDVKSAMKALVSILESQGFTVNETVSPDGTTTLSAENTHACGSYEEAFDELKAMLSNPALTPFVKVDMSQEQADYEQAFSFDAQADFSNVLPANNLEQIPLSLRNTILDGMNHLSGEISMTLPGSQVVECSGEAVRNGKFFTVSAPMKCDSPIPLKLVTRLNPSRGPEGQLPVPQAIGMRSNMNAVFLGVAAVCILLFIVVLVRYARKRQKSS